MSGAGAPRSARHAILDRVMHRLLPRTLPLVLLGPLLAQQQTPAQRHAEQRAQLVTDATARLQSQDIAQVAWGAYAVAEFRLQECVPAVRKALADRPWRDHTADRCAVLVMLDALIQTDAVLPAEELALHLREGAPAIVLMAREPTQNRAALLGRFTSGLGSCSASPEWVACGNLLATMRDPEFVQAVLRSPSQVWLTVCDPGSEQEPYDGEMPGNACSRFEAPKGFPPIARYVLTVDGGHGAVVVAPGLRPVHALRSTFRSGTLHCASFGGYPDYQEARRAWLEQMLGETNRPLVRAMDEARCVVWHGEAAFRKELAEVRRSYEATWRGLVAACVAAKRLTFDPTTEPVPALRFVGVDLRKDQTVPLPDGIADLPR